MNWKKLFQKPIDNITLAASLIALTSLVSRFLGIFRDRILAGRFGAGEVLDIYYAAFRVPDLLYNLLVLGALSAGFIPIFTSLIKSSDHKQAWRLANNTLNILLISLGSLVILGIIFVKPLTFLITPGFSPEARSQVAALSVIMFLSPLLLGASGVVGGILQSFKRFITYSLAPIFYNLGIIFGAVFLVDIWGINGLAWGVVFGATLHLLVQLPATWRLGWRWQWVFDWRDKTLRRLTRLMLPRTLSLAVTQINLVVITIIASGLEAGSLTVFNFANNLQSFPIGIFGISFAIAVFPALSEQASSINKLEEIFSTTIRKILFFIIPSTVLLITLRAQIIRVILGTGAFSWRDTILTMDTLGFFALGLFAQATIPLLVRMFYVREDSKTPFYLGLASVILNIFLALFLGPKLGVAGLALAFSLAAIFQFFLLWLRLSMILGDLHFSKILASTLIFSLAALLAGLGVQIAKLAIWPFIDMSTFIGVFWQLAVSSAVALIIYLMICYWLGSEELLGFLNSLKRRWLWKKVRTGDSSEARGL